MNTKSFTKNEKGFSLIEVLVAMGIFAIGSLAVVALYYSTSGSVRSSNELSEAVFIAEEYLNQTLALRYRNTAYDSAATGAVVGVCDTCMMNRTATEGKYNVSITIDPAFDPVHSDDLSSRPKDGVATITVVVSWNKLFGALSANSFTLQYVRAEARTSGV